MAKKQKILQPQYVQRFQCIGGDCEDSCCNGWRVTIDKDTYELYRKCPDAKLRSKLNKLVTRNRVNPDNNNYAKIKMDIDDNCPFLDEEKLCSIQRSMGGEYLSKTCAVYPRNYNIVNGLLEKSLSLSCPEVARLVLLNTGLMEFDMTEEDTSLMRKYSIKKILEFDNTKKKVEQYFPELRVFTISLLQNRLYPLWQRLVILGLFYNNLGNLVAERKDDKILPLITTYLEHLKEGVFHDNLKNIPVKLDIQISLMKDLTTIRAIATTTSRFVEYFVEAMKGINYSIEATQEELAAQYSLAYENYYQPFFNKHEYILENYLVNYVFANLLPFTGEKNIFDNYIILIVHYSMIKMMLIGMAGFHKEEFNIGHVLKLIQSFTKVVDHDQIYLGLVRSFLRDNKFDNMAHMAILIKN